MEVSQSELRTFSGQFAELFNGSGNLPAYLDALAAQQVNERLKATTIEMRQGVTGGTPMRIVMEAHPDVFTRDFTEGFRQGEAAGAVDVFLKQYAEGNWDSQSSLAAYETAEPRVSKCARPT